MAVHPGDYLLAFTALGLAGVFRGRRWGIFAGTVLGCAGRFLVHYVVGATIWAEYMPEEFLSMTMTSPWLYSLLYNGVYAAQHGAGAGHRGAAYRPMGRYLDRRGHRVMRKAGGSLGQV